MITLPLRKLIIQKSFAAVKSLYGIQEKLSLEGYQDIKYKDNVSVSGAFFLKSEKGNYYLIRTIMTEDKVLITSLRRGKVSVTF